MRVTRCSSLFFGAKLEAYASAKIISSLKPCSADTRSVRLDMAGKSIHHSMGSESGYVETKHLSGYKTVLENGGNCDE